MKISLPEVLIAVVLMIISAAVAFHAVATAGERVATKRFQQEAIRRGYAEYNPTNGVWQWKEQAK